MDELEQPARLVFLPSLDGEDRDFPTLREALKAASSCRDSAPWIITLSGSVLILREIETLLQALGL